MKKDGFSVGLVPFFPCGDRFVPEGYRIDNLSLEQKLEKVKEIPDVKAVELDYPADFVDANKMKNILDKVGLQTSNIEIEFFAAEKWKYGALCSINKEIREEAIRISKEGMDAAVTLGCSQISLWPGQDGFDYVMQTDYKKHWDNTIEAIKEIAEYNKEVKIAIEYKLKEPRTHIQIGTVGKALAIVNEVNLENVGVMIDVGHALMAYENPAESAVILARQNRLFHIHFNDNFRYWDDDLIVGSVHFWETLELLYWLKKINYNGWYSLDIFPYREDGISAIKESIENLKLLMNMVDELDESKISKIQAKNNSTDMIRYLREKMLKKSERG
ncbi:sugar phosphate isomerase/epimerase [bacterium]|nr:sugar phosphate isomerase/epimerase [bacterium]